MLQFDLRILLTTESDVPTTVRPHNIFNQDYECRGEADEAEAGGFTSTASGRLARSDGLLLVETIDKVYPRGLIDLNQSNRAKSMQSAR